MYPQPRSSVTHGTIPRLSPPLVTILLLAAACTRDTPPGPTTFSARDSAGVTIAENTGEAWGEEEGWSLTQEPILSIGVVEGQAEYQFREVTGATRLPDGTVVVADRGAQVIRWYDARGAFLTEAGGRGGGPGEFEGLLWLFRTADTVAVHDERLRRMSYFSPDGGFLRSTRLSPSTGLVFGVFGDGSVLLADALLGERGLQVGYQRPLRAAYRLSAEGEPLDTLPPFPGDEMVMQVMQRGGVRGGVAIMPPPFGRETVFATRGDHFAVGTQNDTEIQLHRPDGALSSLLRWRGDDRLVTEDVLSRHREYWLGRAGDDEAMRRTREWLDGEAYPDSLPAHGDILFDETGSLWVESYQLRGQGPVPWRVFDSSLRLLGQVQVPDRFRIFEIGEAYVLGRWWDEMDVEHVHLYGLVK